MNLNAFQAPSQLSAFGTLQDAFGNVTAAPSTGLTQLAAGGNLNPQTNPFGFLSNVFAADLAQRQLQQAAQDKANQTLAKVGVETAISRRKADAETKRTLALAKKLGVPLSQEEASLLRPEDVRKLATETKKPNQIKATVDGKVKLFTFDDKGNIVKETVLGQAREKPGVTVINKGEELNPGTKKLLELAGTNFIKRNQIAQSAIDQNNTLDRIEEAIGKGALTGFGSEALLNIKSLANSLGVNLDSTFKSLGIDSGNLTEEQVVRALGSRLALTLRNPKSGLGLTGNTSNKDLEFLQSAVPGLKQTREGNLAIIDAMRRLNKFRFDLAQEQARIIQENSGQVPIDLDARLLDFANNYKVFTPEEKTHLESLAANAKDPRQRFNEIVREHPEWTKEQVAIQLRREGLL